MKKVNVNFCADSRFIYY